MSNGSQRRKSVVVIDPLVTATAAAADLHLQLRPGTDAALAFSLLHCLQANGGFDQSYIDAHTSGSDEIAADIARATPTWGEARTGVPAADIERAAALYGAGPALLWCGQGLQRQATGGNIMRAAALLPTLTGNIGKPGAGFCYLNVTPIFAGVDLDWLGGAEIARDGGKRVSHMELAKRLADPDEFKVFFTWNTNPLASAPEQNRLRAALRRDDLFTVVSDVFMTDHGALRGHCVTGSKFSRVRRHHLQLFSSAHGRAKQNRRANGRCPTQCRDISAPRPSHGTG